MGKIKFNIDEVKVLMSKINTNSKLTLVGDDGVYLMAFDEPCPRTIVYAKGCDPKVDEDFYDNKVLLFGGDDGVDDFGTKAELKQIVDACDKYFIVNLTETSISCTNDYTKPKSVKINASVIPDHLKKYL